MPASVKITVIAASLILLLVQPSAAQTPRPPAAPAAPADEAVTSAADRPPVAARERTPMMAEIMAAWDAHAVAVAALATRAEGVADPVAVLAVQRQIEDLRAQVEIEILAIQARYARQEGRLETAVEIEAAIAELTAPRPRGIPVERPSAGDGVR